MTHLLPDSWKPDVAMKRIHIHWTAGAHKANATDKKAYHILIEGDGTVVRGDKSIANNAHKSGLSQASHTFKANTSAIGVSMCCMAGAKESPFDAGKHPMKRGQWDKMIAVVAELARAYDIKVTPTTILTHAEVEPNLNIKQKQKWDITRLAFDDDVRGYRDVGELMRKQIAAILDVNDPNPAPEPEEMGAAHRLPRYRVVDVGTSSLNMRDGPDGAKIGALPERTIVERMAVSGSWFWVRTRLGYVGWVWSDYLKLVVE